MISTFLQSPKVQLGESIAMKGTMLFTPQKQMWKKVLGSPPYQIWILNWMLPNVMSVSDFGTRVLVVGFSSSWRLWILLLLPSPDLTQLIRTPCSNPFVLKPKVMDHACIHHHIPKLHSNKRDTRMDRCCSNLLLSMLKKKIIIYLFLFLTIKIKRKQ